MSVLKSKRSISSLEYGHSFDLLCKITREYLAKTSPRRIKWLNNPITTELNAAYQFVARARHGYYPQKAQHKKDTLRINAAIHLSKMQGALWTIFNVRQFETKKMVRWIVAINNTIDLLCRQLPNANVPHVEILDYIQIKKATYLSKLALLQRYIHGKVVHAPMAYDDTSGAWLISCVNNAFINAIYANKILPKTKNEYLRRREYLSMAQTYLNAAQQESFTYFNLVGYGERVLKEWIALLNECHKIINAVRKSDDARFKNLK